MSRPTSILLVSCGDKPSAQRHYAPVLDNAGWTGPVAWLAPGDALPEGIGGLLLTGGWDLHPCCWDPGEPLHPRAEPDRPRDAQELPLIRDIWSRGLPILGTCRGEQALNVALGGSLVQHVPEHFGCAADRHQHGDATHPELRHRVQLAPASRLRAILGEDAVLVNSRHHQAVRRVAAPLRAVGWHLDTVHPGEGPLVEAVEAADPNRWAFGVQWHPENLVGLPGPAGEAARNLFAAFVAAIQRRSHG